MIEEKPKVTKEGWRVTLRILALVAVAAAAAALLDGLQIVTPAVSAVCETADRQSVFLGLTPHQAAGCRWEQTLGDSDSDLAGADPDLVMHLEEDATGTLTATMTRRLSARNALVGEVREGKAADQPSDFVDAIAGNVYLKGRGVFDWSRPVVNALAAPDRVEIKSIGRLPAAVPADDMAELQIYLRRPAKVEMVARKRFIVGVTRRYGTSTLGPPRESRLTAQTGRYTSLGIRLSSDRRVVADYRSTTGAPGWLAEMTAAAGPAGMRIVNATITAVPWLVLIVVGSIGALAGHRRRPVWRRITGLVAAVLGIHLAVNIVAGLSEIEYTVVDFSMGTVFYDFFRDRLPWTPAVYPRTTGTILLLIAVIVVMVPPAILRLPRLRLPDRDPRNPTGPRAVAPERPSDRRKFQLLHATLVLAAIAGGGVLFVALGSTGARLRSPDQSTLWPVAILTVLPVLAVIGAVAALLVNRRRRSSVSAAWLALAFTTAAALAVAATLQQAGGLLPLAITWGVLLVSGTTALFGTLQLFVYAGTGTRLPWRWALWAVPVLAAVALPWGRPHVTWSDLLILTLRIDGVLGIALVIAAVRMLHRLGARPATGLVTLGQHRHLGICVALLAITASYSLVGQISIVALAAAAGAAWLLFVPATRLRQVE